MSQTLAADFRSCPRLMSSASLPMSCRSCPVIERGSFARAAATRRAPAPMSFPVLAGRQRAEHIEVVRRHLPAEDLHRIAEPGDCECGDVFRAEAVEDCLAFSIMLKARH